MKTAIIAAGDKVGFFVGRGISVPPSMVSGERKFLIQCSCLGVYGCADTCTGIDVYTLVCSRVYVRLYISFSFTTMYIYIYIYMEIDSPQYHPGYGSAWLSRAPSDLESYTGDGSWYKIHQTAGRTEQSPPAGGDKTKNVWGTYNAQTVCSVLPNVYLCTPM